VSIADNVARIRERIAAAAARAGRRADEITLVAVSKMFSADCIREAYDAGVRHFGENRIQEWETKATRLGDLGDATWHLVGHLQSNKARRAVELFTTIDSVDSVALAQRLDRIVAERLAESTKALGSAGTGLPAGPPRLPILIEVRLAPEEAKHGVEPAALPAVVEAVRALPHLDLRGLMCVPPWCENPEDARNHFRRLRELRDSLTAAGARPFASLDAAQGKAAPLRELSMGMSHDFEVAIEEGGTQVRIGTAIFGERG
jgi:pyridoxal phosphate enzyme (YggS family)